MPFMTDLNGHPTITLVTPGHHGGWDQLLQQISNLTGTAAETVAAKTDEIIARGSNTKKLRCTSQAELQAEVEACKRLITLFPALRQQLQWECWVLDNYSYKHSYAHFVVPSLHASLGAVPTVAQPAARWGRRHACNLAELSPLQNCFYYKLQISAEVSIAIAVGGFDCVARDWRDEA